MKFKENPIVDYFSSVRFALFLLPLLVVGSIVGTIIPQDQPIGVYFEKYGQANTVILEILGLSKTYSSIWFKALLVLLCLNLAACSLNRIPQVFKVIKKDNLNADIAKLKRSKDKVLFSSNTDIKSAETAVSEVLRQKNWLVRSRDNGDVLLFFAEKGAWSRLGAYVVHISILIIILGALVGSYFGFKAFVLVPEGGATTEVYQKNDEQTKIPLPFTLRCDVFGIEYYANGMPKEYRSDLVVLEKDKEIVNKRITVNDPLTYSGLTFYQSSYQPIQNQYTVEMTKKTVTKGNNQARGSKQKVYVEAREKHAWQDNQVRFEIVETGEDGHGHGPYKIWFDDEMGVPAHFVLEDQKPLIIERGGASYEIMITQRFATGLQVVKDPGVWLVYLGFGLMLLGLYMAFFMSHRRLWISIQKKEAALTIILAGSSNKYEAGFTKTLEDIATGLLNEKSLKLRRI